MVINVKACKNKQAKQSAYNTVSPMDPIYTGEQKEFPVKGVNSGCGHK